MASTMPVGDPVGEALEAERLQPGGVAKIEARAASILYTLFLSTKRACGTVPEAEASSAVTGEFRHADQLSSPRHVGWCGARLPGWQPQPRLAASTDVPDAASSPTVAAIKERGALRVAAIGEFPWLPENTTGSGPQYSGPAWMLAEEFAEGSACRSRSWCR